MSEGGKLSQEEIDALLGRVSQLDEEESGAEPTDNEIKLEDVLTAIEQDALGEIGNISFGSASTALSTLLNQKVEITTPSVSLVLKKNLDDEFQYPHVAVGVEYTEGFRGTNVLLINMRDAGVIADLMLGGDGSHPSEEIGEIQLSAVQEAMNQMMGSSSTAMSTMFNKRIDISPPTIEILDVEKEQGLDSLPGDSKFLRIKFSIKIGTLMDSSIMQVVPVDFAKELVQQLMNPPSNEEIEESFERPAPQREAVPETIKPEVADEPTLSDRLLSQSYDSSDDLFNSQRAPQKPEAQPTPAERPQARKAKPEIPVHPLEFSPLEEVSGGATDSRNIDLLLDIPLNVTVELGRTSRLIKDILSLVPGTVVELDKLAGEPVDILINNQPIAKGEVVVIDENFGVRITEIVNKKERIQNLS